MLRQQQAPHSFICELSVNCDSSAAILASLPSASSTPGSLNIRLTVDSSTAPQQQITNELRTTMDAFLVRKRPFEDHDKLIQQQQNSNQTLNKRPKTSHPTSSYSNSSYHTTHSATTSSSYNRNTPSTYSSTTTSSYGGSSSYRPSGGCYHSSTAAAASATPFRMHSTASTVVSFEPKKQSRSYQPPPKQITIEQMKKVTDVDQVASMTSVLQKAIDASDWSKVLRLLEQLKGIFITQKVLEATKVGKVVNQMKINLTRMRKGLLSSPTPTATSSNQANEECKEASNPAASNASITASSSSDLIRSSSFDTVDLTEDESHATSAPPSSSSSPNSVLMLSILKLSYHLVETWKAQVDKEKERSQLSGDGVGPSLIFTDYSTHSARIKTYKAIYYQLTQLDQRETEQQKQLRKQAFQQLTPKDLPAARMAAEIETALWKHHLTQQQQRQIERTKRTGAELLSATPANRDEDNLQLVSQILPPGYTFHGRALLNLISQPQQLQTLQWWVPTYAADYQISEDQIELRRNLIHELIQRTKQSFG